MGGELVARCQALTKKGNVCGQPTIPGFPFCMNHINSGSGVGKTHDRYSTSVPISVIPHYEHQLQDDKPRDLTEEIAMQRASLRTLLKQMQDNADNGHVNLSKEDIGVILQTTEYIGRMVERQVKIAPERVVSVQDVLTIVSRIIAVIHEKVPQELMDVRSQIVAGINRCASELLSTSVEQNNLGNS